MTSQPQCNQCPQARRPSGPWRQRITVWSRAGALLALGVWLGASALNSYAQSTRVVLTPATGYTITWDGNNGGYSNPEPGAGPADNPALAINGTTPFGSTEFAPGGIHAFLNVNDGYYGNSSSWISDFTIPDTNAFIGLAFGKTLAVSSIAWGRDNGDNTERSPEGPYTDRAVGIYTLQFTRVSSPSAATPESANPSSGWVTIGTVQYTAGTDAALFSAFLRHRFDVAADGNPIQATGIRIKVSDGGICIDEIEVNPAPDPVPPITNFIAIQAAAGFDIAWDLNDGKMSDPASPAPVKPNRASVSQGTKAFGSSEFGQNVHYITNVNDGFYGNSRSWISDFTRPDPNPFVGLNFGAAVKINNIAWGRDNGNDTEGPSNPNTDRCLGVYTLQVTRVTNPGADTAETGDAATGWLTVGTLNYKGAGAMFTPYLRHRFSLATTNGEAIVATGLRLKVPDAGTAIDEIEVNAKIALEQDLTGIIELAPEGNYTITWDGNDGDYFSADAAARSPDNAAAAANGAVAFGTSELGYGIHLVSKLNDGYYGNSSSWISDRGVGGGVDELLFVGVAFGKTVPIRSIAWGRDNGNTATDACGGTCMDRSIGTYTLMVTTVANPGLETPDTGDPNTGWAVIGTVNYMVAATGFRPYMRHQFEVAVSGQPIPATGIKIKVPDGNTAIDEIEINPTGEVVAPPVTDLIKVQGAGDYSMTWDGNDGEFSTSEAVAPAPVNAALASSGATAFGSSEYGRNAHYITNVIDGLYGNKHSWISDFTVPDTAAFVGVKFPQPVAIRTVAWGRDNGDNTEGPNNPNADRCLGTYTLQVTMAANPGVDTPETGNADTGWATVGTAQYLAAFKSLFNPHMRHRFNVAQGGVRIMATAVRVKVSDGNIAIDELEVNPNPIIDNNRLVVTMESGYTMSWDGNDGEYGNPVGPVGPPDNLALTKYGTVAFGSGELDYGVHFIRNINDGLYGNAHSWIGGNDDVDPYVALRFTNLVQITSIAWGRDNGDDAEKTPAGPFTDRTMGNYTLWVTTVANPDETTVETEDPTTGWARFATLTYRGEPAATFHHYLRHSYDFRYNGQPIPATGLRIRVPSTGVSGGTAIDEIEVNTTLPTPIRPPELSIQLQGGNVTIGWTGTGTLFSADQVTGPWTEVTGAANPYTAPVSAAPQKFYRVRQ